MRAIRPVMIAVHCPECVAPQNDAILVTVPSDIGPYKLIESHTTQPTDRLYVCDECPGCGKRWCVKLLRAA